MGKRDTNQQPVVMNELNEQLKQVEEKWKRALADYQNLEKRVANQQRMWVKIASVSLMEKLLPILDDLKRAQSHLQDNGLTMIIKQMEQMLTDEGVHLIETHQKTFDPQTMECIELVAGPKEKVMEEVIAGYAIDGQVIRPAKVKVGSGE